MGIINKLIVLLLILMFGCLLLKNQIEFFGCSDDISLNTRKFFADGYQSVDCLTGRCQQKGKSYSLQCPDLDKSHPGFVNSKPLDESNFQKGPFLPNTGVSQLIKDAF